MARRKGGFRRGTRSKFKKVRATKGKVSIRSFLQKLTVGDKVKLVAEPAYQRGMYFPRYHGKVGVVVGTSGTCYKVTIKDHRSEKTLIIHPVHLKKV